MKSFRKLFVRGPMFGLALAVLVAGSFGTADVARAGAGHFTYDTGAGEAQSWAGYGDSIMAGYCGIFCSIKSYASYYADSAALQNSWDVALEGFPHSGETTIQIYDEMNNTHNAQMRAADLVIWSAGGNDFLGARSDYTSSCNEAALNQAMADWQADWDLVISLVAAEADPGARIRTMDIYYPNPDQDRQNFCGSDSHFSVFFPLLVEAGDYMCSTAAAAGFQCADSISAMNCDEIDANHTLDPDCYDASGSNFRDPLNVVKYVGGVPTTWPNANNSGMIQSDRTHPGAVGHQYIAAAHHDLGYADGPGGAVCGDAVCDPSEDPLSCPADCADVCGDALCTGSEDALSCPSDCPDVCGDGLCTGSEDTTTCVADCGSLCGDGVCNGGEDEFNCASDCAIQCFADGDGLGCNSSTVCCSGVGNCTGGKPANRVCAPTPSICGDGVVEGSEECEAGVPLADTCTTIGFTGGSLACNVSTCTYDTTNCTGGSCLMSQEACTDNFECCSGNCKRGTCKGN